jgi:nucleoid-associated protein YgaU
VISRESRYASAILFREGTSEFLGARQPLDNRPRSDDRFHIVVDGDRLDLLAAKFLGRAELWWVIADWNEIAWPLELENGQALRIPSLAALALG